MLSQRKPDKTIVHMLFHFPSHEGPAAIWTSAFSLKE